ncbi:MAG: family 1 glycosylhydrolase [Spirochaetes bacterium]|jgi:beta-glucosidase|nr:family 1 glycosylhydrolase [Spirochaetota bacterium]
MTRKFPDSFIWGSAINAYQTEGAAAQDGKLQSIWDSFTAGKRKKRTSPKAGANFYNKFTQDIKLLQQLGIQNFRFSLSWSRIIPDGSGEVNKEAIHFYNRLIETLLEHNIRPHVALYAHDLPVMLQKNGGFLNRETCTAFADYAEVCAKEFGDRISSWITLEDPLTEIEYGYRCGTMAPGVVAPEKLFIAVHNMLVAHSLAYYALKKSRSSCSVGFSTRLDPPLHSNRKISNKTYEIAYAYLVDLFIAPVIKGYYPRLFEGEIYNQNKFNLRPKDAMLIQNSFDFIGIVHSGQTIIRKKRMNVFTNDYLPFNIVQAPSVKPALSVKQPYNPEALSTLLLSLRQDYGNPPVVFTGVGFPASDLTNNTTNDSIRTQFYKTVLSTIHLSIDSGNNIIGFFAKSFLDGFEYNCATLHRSGLIHVDFKTFEHSLTGTAQWYSGVCKTDEI